jgi:hypothetical protein
VPLLATEQRGHWHADLVEHDLARLRAVVTELGQVAHDLEPGRPGRHEKVSLGCK